MWDSGAGERVSGPGQPLGNQTGAGGRELGKIGDIKDIGIIAMLALVVYFIWKTFFTGDPAKQTIKPIVKSLIETNKIITEDIVTRRETFGYIENTPSPGWLGLPPSGSAGMMVYSKKFSDWWK